MQRVRPTIFAVTAIGVSAVALGGCATEGYVNRHVDAKV
jgi:hypothetical protein